MTLFTWNTNNNFFFSIQLWLTSTVYRTTTQSFSCTLAQCHCQTQKCHHSCFSNVRTDSLHYPAEDSWWSTTVLPPIDNDFRWTTNALPPIENVSSHSRICTNNDQSSWCGGVIPTLLYCCDMVFINFVCKVQHIQFINLKL